MNETIHFIITGGTLDSHYDGTKDTAVPNTQSVVPEFINNLHLYVSVEYTTVCLKDSRDIANEDREAIVKVLNESDLTRFVITHGTYTMPDTARYIKKHLQREDQVIILTGSMIPLSGFTLSDGPFNLGFAIAQLEHLTPDVYVAMNGKIFQANEVTKNTNIGRFETL